MALSDKTKNNVDSLSDDELLHEFEKGRTSRFQRDGFAYLKKVLRSRQQEKEDADRETDLSVARASVVAVQQSADHAKDNNAIAEEANRIARRANELAGQANSRADSAHNLAVAAFWLSFGAAIVSAIYAYTHP